MSVRDSPRWCPLCPTNGYHDPAKCPERDEKPCPRCHGLRSVQVGGPDEFGNIDYDDCQVCT